MGRIHILLHKQYLKIKFNHNLPVNLPICGKKEKLYMFHNLSESFVFSSDSPYYPINSHGKKKQWADQGHM